MDDSYIQSRISDLKEGSIRLKELGFPKAELCVKKTNDDWYPCYNKKYVLLTFHSVINIGGLIHTKGRRKKNRIETLNIDFIPTFRVSIWGADDTGIVKDFANSYEAKKLFIKLRSMKYLDQKCLLDLDMEWF